MRPLVTLLVLGLLAAPLAAQAEDSGDAVVVLHLRNGSKVQGSLRDLGSLVLKTPYGKLEIPIGDVRSWTRGASEEDERQDVVRTPHGTYRGWLLNGLEGYEVDTGFGVLTVPAEAIQRLSARGTGLGDDFELDTLLDWRILGGSWSAGGGVLSASEPSGSYTSQIHYDYELPTSYTLRCKLRGDNVGIVWNADGVTNLNLLWLSSGSFYMRTGTNWQNNNLATWGVAPASDGYYHVRLEVDGPRTVVFNNGQRVGEITTTSPGSTAGLFIYSGNGTFDDFLIE